MADQQPQAALQILDLKRFALYGKAPNGERFGSPSFKISSMGGSTAGVTCFPNSASTVEGEFCNLTLHLVELIPFIDTVIEAIDAGKTGEYILSRNQKMTGQNGEERKVEGDFVVKVTSDLVSVGVKVPGKTFITFGIRKIVGYSVEIISDEEVSRGTSDELRYSSHWFKELKSTLGISSLLLDQNSVRKTGGNNVNGNTQKAATEY